MNQKQRKLFLIIITACIALMLLTNVMDGLTSGDWGSPVANGCFAVSGVCLVIAWIQYFRMLHKQK